MNATPKIKDAGGSDCIITDVVRRFAKQTTPEEMQARGVRSVRSVPLSRVAGLIEDAIQSALMQRHLGVVDDHQEAFSEAAREEFVRLIQGGDRSSTPPEAGSALDHLKGQLRQRRQSLAEDRRSLLENQTVATSEDQQLEEELRQVFVSWGGDSDRLSPLEQEITHMAVSALRRERGRAQKADLDRRANEMDLLERRVAKLNRELQTTEAELARVLKAKNIDPGLKSIYSEVQGLSDGDEEFERKSELMTALFAANIELRAKLDSAEVEHEAQLAVAVQNEAEPAQVEPAAVRETPERLPIVELPSRGTVSRIPADASSKATPGGLPWEKPAGIPSEPRREVLAPVATADPLSRLWSTTKSADSPVPVGAAKSAEGQAAEPAHPEVEEAPEVVAPAPSYTSAPSWLTRP